MDFVELRTKYTNRPQGYERKVGYYYCSEVDKMRPKTRKDFRLTPENFFNRKEIDEMGSSRIEKGNAYEEHLERMLVALKIPHQYEPKKYCVINTETLKEVWTEINTEKPKIKEGEICLTVKPDFVFPKHIIETKAPTTPPTEIKRWYFDQLEAEYRGFNLPTYLGIFTSPFDLPTYLYEPSDERWQEIKEILVKFHAKLLKIKQ